MDMRSKFSSQGKVREFEKNVLNQGKVREFYHVHFPKRESGCCDMKSVAFFITRWHIHWIIMIQIGYGGFLVWNPPFLSLAWWLWWIWPIPASWNFENSSRKNQGICFHECWEPWYVINSSNMVRILLLLCFEFSSWHRQWCNAGPAFYTLVQHCPSSTLSFVFHQLVSAHSQCGRNIQPMLV